MFRINEAISRAAANGKKVFKRDLSKQMWPDSTELAQQVNMTALCRGKKQKVAPEWVEIICKECECSADYLFGLKDE